VIPLAREAQKDARIASPRVVASEGLKATGPNRGPGAISSLDGGAQMVCCQIGEGLRATVELRYSTIAEVKDVVRFFT
jgi:hypothetical protein